MKFAKVLSRSGQSLLAARARGIANTVKQEQEALIADSKRKAQGIINELTNFDGFIYQQHNLVISGK